ncbi:hypothetical protein VNO77_18603 [Canavalia gladiata]|uniref:Uncharacterized protein n=1 Tax=Canavalia gladiata TaxID=3824 RepID=A0AAN9LPT6_CANGL
MFTLKTTDYVHLSCVNLGRQWLLYTKTWEQLVFPLTTIIYKVTYYRMLAPLFGFMAYSFWEILLMGSEIRNVLHYITIRFPQVGPQAVNLFVPKLVLAEILISFLGANYVRNILN